MYIELNGFYRIFGEQASIKRILSNQFIYNNEKDVQKLFELCLKYV